MILKLSADSISRRDAVADGVPSALLIGVQFCYDRGKRTQGLRARGVAATSASGQSCQVPWAFEQEAAPHPRIKSGAGSNPFPVRTGRGD